MTAGYLHRERDSRTIRIRVRRSCIRTAVAAPRYGKSALVPLPSPAGPRGRGERKKELTMAEVACFCGCCFSFDGAAGACPKCGEVARLTAGPVTAGRSRPEHPVPVTNGDRQNGHVPDVPPERIEAGLALSDVALSGIAAG
jgi:hypothetical protein